VAAAVQQWVGMLAGCTIAISGSPAFAQSGEVWNDTQSVSPMKADAERGTLKVDGQALTSENPPAANIGSVADRSADGRADTAPIVAWLPSG
jgi:hypothetical protein